jgi:NAD(P)-dependent dehydrogenase (short-subunit alcohol dehydrogenase family)
MERRTDMILKNKNAVIYEGGGAIGGAVARVFAREGARVFIAGRTQAKLDAVATDITAAGGAVETAQVNAFDERSVEKHADAVATKAGGIDIALNAVSVRHDQGTMLVDLSLDEFMKPIDGFSSGAFHYEQSCRTSYGRKASWRDSDLIHAGFQDGCTRRLRIQRDLRRQGILLEGSGRGIGA